MENLKNIAWNNFFQLLAETQSKINNNYDLTDYIKESQQEKLNYLYSENVNVFNFDKVGLPSGRCYDFLILMLKKHNLKTITKQQFNDLILNNAKEIYTRFFKENFEQLAEIEEQLKNKKSLTKETTKNLYKNRKLILQKIFPVCGNIEEDLSK